MSLWEEIAEDMAEVQEQWGVPFADLPMREWDQTKRRERDRLRRELIRLARPPRREARVCPRCGQPFVVMIGARPGRVRTYCSDRCCGACRFQRFWARHRMPLDLENALA